MKFPNLWLAALAISSVGCVFEARSEIISVDPDTREITVVYIGETHYITAETPDLEPKLPEILAELDRREFNDVTRLCELAGLPYHAEAEFRKLVVLKGFEDDELYFGNYSNEAVPDLAGTCWGFLGP